MLAQKLYDENIWHLNITKLIIFKFFIHIASFVQRLLFYFNFIVLQGHLYPTWGQISSSRDDHQR